MSWAEYQDEILRQEWLNKSATEIGLLVHKTRNAVIGRAHRMGLPYKKKPNAKGRGEVERPVVPVPKQTHAKRSRERGPTKPKADPIILPVPGGIHILDLKDTHCRSIIGHGEDGLARYCGASVAERPKRWRGAPVFNAQGEPIYERLAWCPGHCAIFFSNP